MAHSFRDNQNRQWTFEVTVWTVRRLRRETDIDLLAALDPQSDVMERLTTDVGVLFDVMLSLLKDQLATANVTEEDFGRALTEEAAEEATRALLEAIIDFFRGPKREVLQTALAKLWNTTRTQHEQQLQTALKQVNSPEFDQAAEKFARETLGGRANPAVPAGGSSSSSPPPPP